MWLVWEKSFFQILSWLCFLVQVGMTRMAHLGRLYLAVTPLHGSMHLLTLLTRLGRQVGQLFETWAYLLSNLWLDPHVIRRAQLALLSGIWRYRRVLTEDCRHSCLLSTGRWCSSEWEGIQAWPYSSSDDHRMTRSSTGATCRTCCRPEIAAGPSSCW